MTSYGSDLREDMVQRPERLKPSLGGSGLPVPPVTPIVAAVALLVGLSIGVGMGTKAPDAPSATVAPVASIAAASPSPTAGADSTDSGEVRFVIEAQGSDWVIVSGGVRRVLSTNTVPPGGVSLTTAAANKTRPVKVAEIISARIVPYSQVHNGGDGETCELASASGAAPACVDPWVWAIVVRGSAGAGADYKTVVVDYQTGKWIETLSGFLP
jgi:hypothetical protein